MRGKRPDSPINTKVKIRKFITHLNIPDPAKLKLEINYYDIPPEDEATFKNHLIDKAYTVMPYIFDPIWMQDKYQDWQKMNVREFLTDLLHYCYLETEEAHYEHVHNYFGPSETIRTDMRPASTAGHLVLRILRLGLGIAAIFTSISLLFSAYLATTMHFLLGSSFSFLGIFAIFKSATYAIYGTALWLSLNLFKTKAKMSMMWKIIFIGIIFFIARQIVSFISNRQVSQENNDVGEE